MQKYEPCNHKKEILAMQPCKSMSHAEMLKGDLGCVLVC